MFCTQCSRQIQDDARFCAYCAAPISPLTTPETAPPGSPVWELCEVELEQTSKGFGGVYGFGQKYRFVAVASGPAGRRTVDATPPLANGYADKRFGVEVRSLADRLLRDGWEPLPSATVASGVQLPRFQRRAGPR